MIYTGDGWAVAPDGSRRWGTLGAAGLFLTTTDDSGRLLVLMQHRAVWTNRGGTWALPGGACDVGETPQDAAVRETWEETGVQGRDVTVLGSVVTSRMGTAYVLRRAPVEDADAPLVRPALDAIAEGRDVRAELAENPVIHPGHGGRAIFGLGARLWWEIEDADAPDWTYTVVLARAAHQLELNATAESQDLAWWPAEDLEELDLMPEFAASLPMLLEAYRDAVAEQTTARGSEGGSARNGTDNGTDNGADTDGAHTDRDDSDSAGTNMAGTGETGTDPAGTDTTSTDPAGTDRQDAQ